jgi:hypothetical protein
MPGFTFCLCLFAGHSPRWLPSCNKGLLLKRLLFSPHQIFKWDLSTIDRNTDTQTHRHATQILAFSGSLLFLSPCPEVNKIERTLSFQTVHIAHCTLHIAHCILHIAYCTLHIAHCTLHIAHCTLHIAHCALHIAHCALHIAQ